MHPSRPLKARWPRLTEPGPALLEAQGFAEEWYREDGSIVGGDELASYFVRVLEAYPELRFERLALFLGAGSVVLHYRSVRGLLAAEAMGLGRDRRVTTATAITTSCHSAIQTHKRKDEMNTYAIRRHNAWQSPEEVEQVAKRSMQVADDDFPADIRWIRSYVIAEEDGTLGSICIYQASDPDAIRKHAQRVGMPADEILDVADLVVIRPDPARERTAS